MRRVLLMLFPVLPMQAHTQESEQLSKSVQEKRDQRQRLGLLPRLRMARALGEITVKRLNGLWIFSTPSKAIVNRYKFTKLHEDGPILHLEGIDLDEGTPVVLFHRPAVEEIGKNAFALVDPNEEGCDVYFEIEPSRIWLKASTTVRRRCVKPYLEKENGSRQVAIRSPFVSLSRGKYRSSNQRLKNDSEVGRDDLHGRREPHLLMPRSRTTYTQGSCEVAPLFGTTHFVRRRGSTPV